MKFLHAVKVHRNSRGLSILLQIFSTAWGRGVRRNVLSVSLHWGAVNHFSCWPDLPGQPVLSASDGSLKPCQSVRSFKLFLFEPIFDWIWDTGKRKKNNQFHESLHAQSCLCTPSIPFIFHCQSQPSWQRHKGLISQYQTSVSKIQKVWWSDGNNWIHALKPRRGLLPHKHTQWMQSEIQLKFALKPQRRSKASVSGTCPFPSTRADRH